MVDSLRGVVRDHIVWETTGKTDVYPLVEDDDVRQLIVERLAGLVSDDVDRVVGIEATGFVFGSMVAEHLGLGMVCVRRREKWPYDDDALIMSSCEDYSGSSKTFAVRSDQVVDGETVVIVDDWVETGSQYRCVSDLLRRGGATVAHGVCIAVENGAVGADDVSRLITVD